MDLLLRDLRTVLRGLRRSPGFLVVAVATIALGIGVNSTIFSLVNAVMLRPLPVERPQELVDVYGHPTTLDAHESSSYPDFLDFREGATTLSGLAAYTNFIASLSVEGSTELAIGELVSEDYFRVLGVSPALGRTFAPEEFRGPGAGPVAILSHPFWMTRFGGDPQVVGRTLRMNGVAYTVVGVAPRGFGGMFPAVTAQMWIPVSMADEVEPVGSQRGTLTPGAGRMGSRDVRFLWMRGRMRPGVDPAAVQAELDRIGAALAEQSPETNARERVRVVATGDVLVNPDFDGTLAPAAWVLLAAVGLVLLVACANLANMMLARAASRERELAVRVALGADRGHLIRQVLMECIALALAGGAVALLLAWWLAGVVAAFQPPLPVDLGLDISPDGRVLLFTFGVALATGLLFGLVPALRASRPDLVPSLKEGGGGRGRGRHRMELRDVLVVGQVTLSVALLVTGALLARSLGAAARVDLGYDADRTAQLSLAMGMNGYTGEEAWAFFREALLRIEGMPGVESAGMASRVPLGLNNNTFGLYLDGHQSSPDDAPYTVGGALVDEGYLPALGLQLRAGRGIESADRDDSAPVAVVTSALAARFWPGEDPLGRELRRSWDGRPHRVVGVVEDHRVNTPGEAPTPYILFPMPPDGTFASLVVRTAGPAAPMVPRLEAQLRGMDPDLTFLETGTLRDLAEVRTFAIRLGAWLIGAFGVLALVLASVGLYGVISYSVGRRVREIGIRKALGAEAGQVTAMVLGQGMVLVAVGCVLGGALATAGARALSGVLFVGPLDPVSFAGAFLVLVAVAALANWVPARRAAAVDPVEALRAG